MIVLHVKFPQIPLGDGCLNVALLCESFEREMHQELTESNIKNVTGRTVRNFRILVFM